MTESKYKKICLYINKKIDNIKGDDYTKEKYRSTEKYKDYVIREIFEESGIKEILNCFFVWESFVINNNLGWSTYSGNFDDYIIELKAFFDLNFDRIYDYGDMTKNVLEKFYTLERRKEILKEVLKK